MRALCLRPLVTFTAVGIHRYYGGRSDSRPPPPGGRFPRGGGGPPPNNRNLPNEPQIIARLMEQFPTHKGFVPISRWATALPDDLQEALVPYGGLSAFARAQANFFIVRQENGVPVVSLSSMGAELSHQRRLKQKQKQKQAEKQREKRAKFDAQIRSSAVYVPPSQRK